MTVYQQIISNIHGGRKMLAVLLDPDKCEKNQLDYFASLANKCQPDFVFVGSSLSAKNMDETILYFKQLCKIPVIIFPGNTLQVSQHADALLFLSLISGRNPEFLIGQHVLCAAAVKQMKLETIPVGYMLIDGQKPTSVEYISNTRPIPNDKPDIAVSTAVAGELLGLKMIYLEAGSGAFSPVPKKIIAAVKENISLPLLVGGGIRSIDSMNEAFESGADVVVVGNLLEKEPNRMQEFVNSMRK